ncbi:hypothetical protein J4G48_0040210 [Bradyrhizobium barranii subsp. apii]|uniref:hypothetical protein n=1 Tax=Bradyrhizobium barranii TaxID=2992140 RepID=UPI001AA17E81|nr:hypothetical protein [Bradyrhizobium barranii]UPT95382.1 hypothetical protein J4G48_0040210 [Bradyrhizobium barranii subsp. apii]
MEDLIVTIILPFRRMIPKAGPTITPGSASFTSPGTYTFVVPYYNSLTADVRGGGGGGGGARYSDSSIYYASAGNYSYFAAPDATLIGYGGGGANGAVWSPPRNGDNGSPGTAAGGDGNITGGGSAGGQGAIISAGGSLVGGTGGAGGRAYRTWVRSQWYTKLTPRTSITVVVGDGGAKSECEPAYITQYNTNGQSGAVYISWS